MYSCLLLEIENLTAKHCNKSVITSCKFWAITNSKSFRFNRNPFGFLKRDIS